MIYVSTGGYKDLEFEAAINKLSLAGIVAFELSGGRFSEDVPSRLYALSKKYSLALHNYFPPPKVPFVLNLASFRDDIVQASIDHIIQAIDISHSCGAKFYAFHAGYLIDPPVSELGARINRQKINCRKEALESFVAHSNKLAAYAETKGVKLLVENNVLSSANYKSFDENPLLMVDQAETHEIMSCSHRNLGLLIDVAHLKVSANTLDFSAAEYLNAFYDSVDAYHFSDNLGLEDSNDEVTRESWFWPHINKGLDYYSLEIYDIDEKKQMQQLKLVTDFLQS